MSAHARQDAVGAVAVHTSPVINLLGRLGPLLPRRDRLTDLLTLSCLFSTHVAVLRSAVSVLDAAVAVRDADAATRLTAAALDNLLPTLAIAPVVYDWTSLAVADAATMSVTSGVGSGRGGGGGTSGSGAVGPQIAAVFLQLWKQLLAAWARLDGADRDDPRGDAVPMVTTAVTDTENPGAGRAWALFNNHVEALATFPGTALQDRQSIDELVFDLLVRLSPVCATPGVGMPPNWGLVAALVGRSPALAIGPERNPHARAVFARTLALTYHWKPSFDVILLLWAYVKEHDFSDGAFTFPAELRNDVPARGASDGYGDDWAGGQRSANPSFAPRSGGDEPVRGSQSRRLRAGRRQARGRGTGSNGEGDDDDDNSVFVLFAKQTARALATCQTKARRVRLASKLNLSFPSSSVARNLSRLRNFCVLTVVLVRALEPSAARQLVKRTVKWVDQSDGDMGALELYAEGLRCACGGQVMWRWGVGGVAASPPLLVA